MHTRSVNLVGCVVEKPAGQHVLLVVSVHTRSLDDVAFVDTYVSSPTIRVKFVIVVRLCGVHTVMSLHGSADVVSEYVSPWWTCVLRCWFLGPVHRSHVRLATSPPLCSSP